MENRVRKQVKKLLLEENLFLKELVEILSEKTGREYRPDSFSHRLARAKISYEEMLDIADVLGYEIVFKKKNND